MSHLSSALPSIWDLFQLPAFLSGERTPKEHISSEHISSEHISEEHISRERQPVLVQNLGLTPETLLEIFKWAVTLSDDAGDIRGPRRWAPMNISHTCHSWRELALAHACLWARIDVSNASLASLWLERAGRSLLRINYSSYKHRSPASAKLACENWHTVLQRQHSQLQKMMLEFDPTVPFKRLTLPALPNLIEWECRHPDPFSIFCAPGRVSHTEGPIAPRLTSLLIEAADFKDVYGLANMLQHTPKLKLLDLHLDMYDGMHSAFWTRTPIRLRCLEELYLSGTRDSVGLLRCLTAPALTRLVLQRYAQSDVNAIPGALLAFLVSRPTNILKTVNIKFARRPGTALDESAFNENDHAVILKALANVQDLSLPFPCGNLTCRLLEQPRRSKSKHIRRRPHGYCPQLKRLAMIFKTETDLNAIQSMVSSRSKDFELMALRNVPYQNFDSDSDFED